MDEFGIFRPSKEDFDDLAKAFALNRNIVFCYSEDNIGAIILSINATFNKLGIMPFGGNPNGRIWVSVYSHGCTHLSWSSDATYIQEKLRLGRDESEWISKILKEIATRIHET